MNQFTPRECRRCHGEGQRHDENEPCFACNGSGVFEARLKRGWTMPAKPVAACYAEAYIGGGDEWDWVGWRGRDGLEYGEIPWPFATQWADGEDFRRLGFYVVVA
jgi:hypothetical protein